MFKARCSRCSFAGLDRAPRRWWMRLLGPFRRYHCGLCRQSFLALKSSVNRST
jgi:hypothetical protein